MAGWVDPGEVAEWSKANDSKSFEGKPSVGSNPTLSVFTGSEGIRGNPKITTVQPICAFRSSSRSAESRLKPLRVTVF